jgi:hypothetical protein
MPTLVSPGVSISVIDESFYGSAGSGTVPLICVATGKNKTHPSGTGSATGTTGSTAALSLITSQRELLQTYGNPSFRKVGGTLIHGDNQNEYGLLAAHSYLGLANRAYVLRAAVDLSELEAAGTAPTGSAVNGTYWLDLSSSNMGVFTYNAATATWVAATVSEISATTDYDAGTGAPLNSVGLDGEFAWVAVAGGNSHNRVWQKVGGVWYHLGTNTWAAAASKDFQFAAHTAVPTVKSTSAALATGDVWIKTSSYNSGSEFKVKLYNSATKQWTTITSPVLASTTAAWTNYTTPVTGNIFVKYNHEQGAHTLKVASHQLLRFNGSATLAVTGSVSNSTQTLLTPSHSIVVNGTTITWTGSSDTDIIRTAALINSAGITDISASVSSNKIVITNTAGKDITLAAGTGTMLADLGLTAATSSNWIGLSYEPNTSAPTGTTADGTLWYDSRNTTVDMLETYDNSGTTAWRTFSGTMTAAASKPTTPASGDVWLDTVAVDAYPSLYKYNGTTTTWDAIDNTDQTSNQGIVFGNFRSSSSAALETVTTVSPNPAVYPVGILGWNFMASGYDVKKYDGTAVKWYNESGLKTTGAPYMGRFAQKKVITVSMAAALSGSEEIRAETRFFNLICAPGFPELIDEMKTLNVDRKETAFVIGDTPFRLTSDATSLKNWASNTAVVAENGEDGLVSSGFDIGVWYPGGCYTTNVTGDTVVQPASHIVLRTMGYNDQVAYEWFAPAGYQRGLVNNATSVGYIDAEGEYNAVVLNQGQRDVLYVNKMNPIAHMPNRGLTVWGQKTLHTLSSALDRVNVARLVAYLRRRFDDMSQPFLFEPNDEFTRNQVLSVFNQFLGDMITKRGLYDFLVVCDTSNNTPTRIDRNELWVDVAIQPVKAVEFIYIPIRVRNTGESLTIAGAA